ncbi:hypothetical protein Ocin01_14090 [Orchesella cincta]|uniref:Uncharacterized protein n=1 Tax=Orchesella cincta TaxID=48709 RepID=A0A1D2MI05_ORCCI|nr:hypothetical protein Ocin01_14090 [Orchesella cincta]
MAKLIITLFALVALAAVAIASPMGIGMGHGVVTSHHSHHIGHGLMGYPGIGMMGIGHGVTMHKSYHGIYPGMGMIG